ncbi:benzoylformate decarboxylase [Xylariaceae sp. FL0804]|nr:benzoylformate decarboxylase [Xylariaceae sp. FL0804]
MVDGYAQATRNPTLAVVYTAAGVANAMGNIATAFLNRSPVVVLAGNQAREYLVGDPLIINRDPTMLPQPYVKWSYEPANTAAVLNALTRAIAMAQIPPAGPQPYNATPPIRTVSTRVRPDPDRLAEFTARIRGAENLALDAGVALAELLQAPVYSAPLQSRAVFPAGHPLYKGSLAIAQADIALQLASLKYDLVLVVGAEVFRYYPFVDGPVLEPGTSLLQITNSPHDAGSARIGDAILSDAKLALEALYRELRDFIPPSPTSAAAAGSGSALASASVVAATSSAAAAGSGSATPSWASVAAAAAVPKPSTGSFNGNGSTLMTADQAWQAVAIGRRASDLLVQESPSNEQALLEAWAITQPATYYTSASQGLGWGLPAAVGIALAQPNRTVVLALGDGSIQYSVQAIYTAVQHRAKVIIMVPQNNEYAILKEFAEFEEAPNCPGLDLPGMDLVKLAQGYGCTAFRAKTPAELYRAFENARKIDGPAFIVFPINPKLEELPL